MSPRWKKGPKQLTLRLKGSTKTLLIASVIMGTAITLATWFNAVPITIGFSQSGHVLSETMRRGFPRWWVVSYYYIATGSGMQLQPLGLAEDIIFWSAIVFVVLFLISKVVMLRNRNGGTAIPAGHLPELDRRNTRHELDRTDPVHGSA